MSYDEFLKCQFRNNFYGGVIPPLALLNEIKALEIYNSIICTSNLEYARLQLYIHICRPVNETSVLFRGICEGEHRVLFHTYSTLQTTNFMLSVTKLYLHCNPLKLSVCSLYFLHCFVHFPESLYHTQFYRTSKCIRRLIM